jgi:DNA-binding response OmpR family regulator
MRLVKSSGAAALDSLKHSDSRVELVVADVAMPGLNGVELAAIVQRTWRTLPVLLMTGYADSALLGLAADHEVLRKPFQAAELDAKVRCTIAPGSGKRLTGQGTASHRFTPATLP